MELATFERLWAAGTRELEKGNYEGACLLCKQALAAADIAVETLESETIRDWIRLMVNSSSSLLRDH